MLEVVPDGAHRDGALLVGFSAQLAFSGGDLLGVDILWIDLSDPAGVAVAGGAEVDVGVDAAEVVGLKLGAKIIHASPGVQETIRLLLFGPIGAPKPLRFIDRDNPYVIASSVLNP